jgi:hypothetical protein
MLPISMPMLACLGIGLKELQNRQVQRIVMALVGTLAAIVAVLVT